MAIGKLRPAGMALFNEHLDKLEINGNHRLPQSLYNNTQYFQIINDNVELQEAPFQTRFQAGRYLYNLFKNLKVKDLEKDVELWAWITAKYIEKFMTTKKEDMKRNIDMSFLKDNGFIV